MAIRKYISVIVRTTFIGFHRWVDAPDWCIYLRNFHRHEFHVELGVRVTEMNRQIEFIELKKELNVYLDGFRNKTFEYSCEQLADKIVEQFRGQHCEVSEDGENGAIVHRIDTPW